MFGAVQSADEGITIIVNSFVDDTVDNGNCTLREAILAANADAAVDGCKGGSGADIILLPAGTFEVRIPSDTPNPDELIGDLDIFSSVTISGAGPLYTIIQSDTGDRVFEIKNEFAEVTLSGISIEGGFTPNTYPGAGILNLGTLRIANSHLHNNHSWGTGGGIDSSGSLSIIGSDLSENWAQSGGGVFSRGTLTIQDSRIAENGSRFGGAGILYSGESGKISNCILESNGGRYGGGLYLDGNGSLTIDASLVYTNTAYDASGAGVLVNSGTLTITNSTVSSNLARGSGGGLLVLGGEVVIMNTTITGNKAGYTDNLNNGFGSGGGLEATGGRVYFRNSIIAGNKDLQGSGAEDIYPDCSVSPGVIVSEGQNILGVLEGCNWTAASGDFLGTTAQPLDPLLTELSDNGGKTQMHALLDRSPAVDSGTCYEDHDQRGVSRPQGPGCDIGSYEAVQVGVVAATAKEGDQGTTEMEIQLRLSGRSPQEIQLNWKTVDGTALAGSDYLAASGSLTYPPGTTDLTIPVSVLGDPLKESDEYFSIELSGLVGGVMAGAQGTGTILNDDFLKIYLPVVNLP
jgi:CSLREA domain-containing protein